MPAIGKPFGLEGTLTAGIISSLGRTIADEQGRELEGMLQTDAAIHPVTSNNSTAAQVVLLHGVAGHASGAPQAGLGGGA